MSKTNTNRVNTEGAEREARTRFERLVTAAGVSVKETGKTAAGEYFDPRVALAWKLYRALHHAGRPAPEGYVLVPREPTQDMWMAGQDCAQYDGPNGEVMVMAGRDVCGIYAAMLAAAPGGSRSSPAAVPLTEKTRCTNCGYPLGKDHHGQVVAVFSGDRPYHMGCQP